MAEEGASSYDPELADSIRNETMKLLGYRFTRVTPSSAQEPGPSQRQVPTASPKKGLGLRIPADTTEGTGGSGGQPVKRRLTPFYAPGTVRPAPSTSTSGSVAAGGPPGGGPGHSLVGTYAQDLSNRSWRQDLLMLVGIFLVSLLCLLLVYSTFPKVEDNEKQYIKVPRNMEDAKGLANVLNRYKEKYYFNVLCAVFLLYIFLQTFAIPGSIMLSILSGFLFSYWLALLLVCFCSATGATFCYGLSWMLGRRLVYKYFPERVESWAEAVNSHRDNIWNYMFFLRVTPFVPNFFINIASPILAVPVVPFYLGTFIGVAPPSFVLIHAGTTMHTLASTSDAISWTAFWVFIGLGCLALVPVIWKDAIKSKFL